MTGSPFSWEKRSAQSEEVSQPTRGGNDYIDYSYAKYLGGHPLYVDSRKTGVYIYNDRIEIVDPALVIPFSEITRIENMDEKKIDREKVVMGLLFFTPLAIHAAISKKKHTYTIIQYNNRVDEISGIPNLGQIRISDLIRHNSNDDKITIVLDFDADIDRIQTFVYHKMIESRH